MSSKGKVVIDIVTGASNGIGRAIAESIACHRRKVLQPQDEEYKLVLLGRNANRGNKAASQIAKETNLSVEFQSCDLSKYSDIQRMRQKLLEGYETEGRTVRVDILVNNAAECPLEQKHVTLPLKGGTTKSVDKQFASNVLGYHFMLSVFRDLFQDSHVVMVASNWAGDLDLQDLFFSRRKYDNDTAYRQSKQCNRMLSAKWAQLLKGTAVVNACHPGDPCTKLSTDLGYNTYASSPSKSMIETQSSIPFLCGLLDDKNVGTGGWFDGGNTTEPMKCRYARMEKETKDLFDICESFCL